MSEQVVAPPEIPTILATGVDIEIGGVPLRVVPFKARTFLELIQEIANTYVRIMRSGEFANAPDVQIITEVIVRIPELQARSLRYRAAGGTLVDVPVEWVVANLEAKHLVAVVGAILDANDFEATLKNYKGLRFRVGAALAGLRSSTSSPANTDAPPTPSSIQ